nr:hypothetical protein [Tanacetum cinerariifolium]
MLFCFFLAHMKDKDVPYGIELWKTCDKIRITELPYREQVVTQSFNEINPSDQDISPLKITISQNSSYMIIPEADSSQKLPDEIDEKL